MNFKYMALERDNRVVSGMVEAGDDALAENSLRQQGLKVVSIRPASEPWRSRTRSPRAPSAKPKEVVFFSQQLATLLDTGTPLLMALQLLRDQSRSAAFRDLLDALIADLKTGVSLHGAMSKTPKAFSQVYVRLIEAGERSGTLEAMLRHVAAYLQKEMAVMQQAKKALAYPAIVAGVGVMVVGMLVTVVLPSLAELLTSFSADLPLITRLVLDTSNLVQAWKVPGILTVLALGGLAVWYIRTPNGRKEVDRLLLSAPVVGRLLVQWNLARFNSTMALLLNAGLTLPESLERAGEGVSSPLIREAIGEARGQVIEGRSLAEALGVVPSVPALYLQMVKAGEQSGTLESNLASMAELYERDVQEQITGMTGMIEPLITLAMGGVVAFIALAVLMPMFSLLSSFQPS